MNSTQEAVVSKNPGQGPALVIAVFLPAVFVLSTLLLVCASKRHPNSRTMRLFRSFIRCTACRRRRSRMRDEFLHAPMPVINVENYSGNPHAAFAAMRRSADTFMNGLARFGGQQNVYSVSGSPSDMEQGIATSHGLYTSKDTLNLHLSDAPLPARCVVKMVDVDHYLSPAQFTRILSWRRDVLIYTTSPRSAGGVSDDGKQHWGFDGDQYYAFYEGNDGVVGFRHELWDYSTDHLVVRRWWGALVYRVTTRRANRDRVLVLMEYERSLAAGPLAWLLSGSLRRRKFNVGTAPGCTRVDTLDTVSVALPDAPSASVDLPRTIFDRAVNAYMLDPAGPWTTSKFLSPEQATAGCGPTFFRALQVMYGEKPVRQRRVDFNVDTAPAVAYRPVDLPPDTRTKPLGRSFMNPVMTGHVVVEMSTAAGAQAVEGRVEKVRSVQDGSTLPMWQQRALLELIPLILDGFHGVPFDIAMVLEAQNRPQQRSRWKRVATTIGMPFAWVVKAMVKTEAYFFKRGLLARIISQVPAEMTTLFSRYTLPLAEHMKKTCPAYCPGRQPAQIAERIANMAARCPRLDPADFSKMDGRLVELAINWLAMLLNAAYPGQGAGQWMLGMVDAPAFLNFKNEDAVRYNVGTETLSGSPATTWGNTTWTLVIMFLARLEPGVSVADAWSQVNSYDLAYGDDAVVGSQDVGPHRINRFVKTATLLGQVVKPMPGAIYAPVAAESTVLEFVSREFPNPWTAVDGRGAMSVPAFQRLVSKFHITKMPPTIPPLAVGYLKAQAGLIADSATPYLDTFYRAVLALTGDQSRCTTELDLLSQSHWLAAALADRPASLPSPPLVMSPEQLDARAKGTAAFRSWRASETMAPQPPVVASMWPQVGLGAEGRGLAAMCFLRNMDIAAIGGDAAQLATWQAHCEEVVAAFAGWGRSADAHAGIRRLNALAFEWESPQAEEQHEYIDGQEAGTIRPEPAPTRKNNNEAPERNQRTDPTDPATEVSTPTSKKSIIDPAKKMTRAEARRAGNERAKGKDAQPTPDAKPHPVDVPENTLVTKRDLQKMLEEVLGTQSRKTGGKGKGRPNAKSKPKGKPKAKEKPGQGATLSAEAKARPTDKTGAKPKRQ